MKRRGFVVKKTFQEKEKDSFERNNSRKKKIRSREKIRVKEKKR